MDEETERLRDIFVETTGEETVTEEQTDTRGSLLDQPNLERLPDVVGEMRAEFDFSTALDDDALCTVVREFYGGGDDAAIAEELGVDERTVFRARTDLHLLRDGDADPELLAAVRGDDEVPDEADPAAVERAERVARAQNRARRASERFRTAFEELLTDAALSEQFAAEAQADGLREAAEDIETDVDF